VWQEVVEVSEREELEGKVYKRGENVGTIRAIEHLSKMLKYPEQANFVHDECGATEAIIASVFGLAQSAIDAWHREKKVAKSLSKHFSKKGAVVESECLSILQSDFARKWRIIVDSQPKEERRSKWLGLKHVVKSQWGNSISQNAMEAIDDFIEEYVTYMDRASVVSNPSTQQVECYHSFANKFWSKRTQLPRLLPTKSKLSAIAWNNVDNYQNRIRDRVYQELFSNDVTRSMV
tara:strand:- start:830 stop:1531 length:702 start_codon:yes stop_codon:yes gene_type:complete